MARTRLILLLATLSVTALPAAAGAADLSVTDAFSRATPGQGPGVAYLTIHGGDTADRLDSVTSSLSKVEMHTMTMDGTVMRMRQLDTIDVPAHGDVKLQPGGMHLMLTTLPAPLKAGQTVPLTLHFEHAGTKTVDVPVGAIGAAAPPGAPGSQAN